MPAPTEKLTKKEMSTKKVVALSITVGIVFVVIAGFALKVLVAEIFTNQKVLSATSKAKTDIDTKKANAITVLNDYHNLGGLATVALQGLPTYPAFPELANVEERIAGASGVALQTLAPTTAATVTTGSGSSVGGAQPLSFAVSLSGSYNNIAQFIKNTELSLRPMRVDDMTLTGSGGALTATMDFTTYYQAKANISDKTEAVK